MAGGLKANRKGAGWALPEKRTYQNQEYQDKLDAATIYSLLENEITPLFFNKTKGKTYSADWVKVVKKFYSYYCSTLHNETSVRRLLY